jgi:hypothetical protein
MTPGRTICLGVFSEGSGVVKRFFCCSGALCGACCGVGVRMTPGRTMGETLKFDSTESQRVAPDPLNHRGARKP